MQERLARVPRAVLFEYPEAIGLGYPQCHVRVPRSDRARVLQDDGLGYPRLIRWVTRG
ncbi:unnamed protein product [Arabidopsis halleri]